MHCDNIPVIDERYRESCVDVVSIDRMLSLTSTERLRVGGRAQQIINMLRDALNALHDDADEPVFAQFRPSQPDEQGEANVEFIRIRCASGKTITITPQKL